MAIRSAYNRSIFIVVCCIFAGFLIISCQSSPEVTFEGLVSEMGDRRSLTIYPEPVYTLKQFSSYDRRSISKDSGWFANRDYTHFLRKESKEQREEYVLFEDFGPGAIVRWWMTFAGEGSTKGIIRVYLDGAEIPLIEDSVLSVLSGSNLTSYPLSASVSEDSDYTRRGHNLYFPIPYNTSCKITYECEAIEIGENVRKPNIYYNVNYREYPDGTDVRTLSSSDITLHKERWKSQNTLLNRDTGGVDKLIDIKLMSGESKSIHLTGPAAITSLDIEGLSPAALRSTQLKINFDEKVTVSTPLGDFFNTGYIITPFETAYSGVDANIMHSYHWMPFQKSASIELINHGDQEISVKGNIQIKEYNWTVNSMYFGAYTHEYNKIVPAGILNPAGRSPEDLTFIDIEGSGVYVSDAIVLFNTDDAWWGEGDEKIYVDGEQFPSSFGTGTEDYYGYAWARPEKFSHPFIAQPDGSGNFYPGYTVNVRHRVLDAIPFASSLKVDMELLHWVTTPMNYSITTKFYVKGDQWEIKGRKEFDYSSTPVLDRHSLLSLLPDSLHRWEGEHLKIYNSNEVHTTTQYIPSFNWSNKGQLWWTEGRIGDHLVLVFESYEEFKGDLELGLTKAVDYGSVDIYLNDKFQGNFDAYTRDSVFSVPFILKDVVIAKGENQIKLTLKPSNPSAKEGNMVGIDYLQCHL